MRPALLLAVALVVIAVAVVIWDAIAIGSGNRESTVSLIIREWSHGTPILPFVAGVIVGHLFW